MQELTFTMENYLEAVYELSIGGTGARITDIAARMGVSKASANSAMAGLADRGLITNERYQEIYLTPAGLERARAVARKHAVLKRFLTEVLGVGEDTADADACAIEHVISRESVHAMQRYMAHQALGDRQDG